QTNFDKKLLWRPRLNIEHAIGRHTYPDWPKHNGKECADAGIKLFPLHHCGGAEDTARRNRRDYARATNKARAWNYAPGHNDNPQQVGSVAWVRDAIQNHKLIDVMGNSCS